MTTTSLKPTTRETSAFVRERGLRPLVVTIHHGLIELRPKGLRSRETLDLASVYNYAVRSRIFRDKMEKAKERKARRKK